MRVFVIHQKKHFLKLWINHMRSTSVVCTITRNFQHISSKNLLALGASSLEFKKPDKLLCYSDGQKSLDILYFCPKFLISRRLSGFTASHKSETEPEQTLKEVCGDLLDQCRERDKSLYSVTEAEAEKRIQVFLEAGFPMNNARQIVTQSPYLLKSKNFYVTTQLLLDHGFSWRIISRIYQRFSRVLDIDSDRLSLTIGCLRRILSNEQKLHNAITNNPGILSADEKHITKRTAALKELFKSKDSVSLIVKCPSVMFDEWTEIQEKFDYVFLNMGITQRQMMYSSIFEHSLHHIQCRHVYLLRAGLFKKVKKQKGEMNRNPLLEDILDTSDKAFAKKFGNMTETDYKTFCKYFEIEKREINHSYRDSAEDSDYESDDSEVE